MMKSAIRDATASAEPVHSQRRLRDLIARHPVAAMLLLMFGFGWALLIPAALAGIPFIPFPLLGTVLLGQLGSGLLVMWAADGWPGVRGLLGRVFRWRVHPAWYLVSLLAIPVASLLWTAVVFGGGALQAMFTKPSVIEAYLAVLTILPIVNLWEEMAWMGVIQARLTTYRGPVVAAVITSLLFGLFHLPFYLGQPIGAFLLGIAVLMVLSIALRTVLGWMYNATGGSILMVALVHATWNATNNTNFLVAAAPGQAILQPSGGAVILVVLAWAVAVLIVTRGRLGYRQNEAIARGSR